MCTCMSVFLFLLLFVLSGRAMLVVVVSAHRSSFCKAEFCSKLGLELKPIFLMTLYSTQLFQSLGAETQLQIYSALATGKLLTSLLQQYDLEWMMKIFRYYLLDIKADSLIEDAAIAAAVFFTESKHISGQVWRSSLLTFHALTLVVIYV